MTFPLNFFSYKGSDDGSVCYGKFVVSNGDDAATIVIRPFTVVPKPSLQLLPSNKILRLFPLKHMVFLALSEQTVVINKSALVEPIMVAHYDHFITGNLTFRVGFSWMFATTSADPAFSPSRFVDAVSEAQRLRGRDGSWDFLRQDDHPDPLDVAREYMFNLYLFRDRLATAIHVALSARRAKGNSFRCAIAAEPDMAHSLLSTPGVYPYAYHKVDRFVPTMDQDVIVQVPVHGQVVVMGIPCVSSLRPVLGDTYHIAVDAAPGFKGGQHTNVRYLHPCFPPSSVRPALTPSRTTLGTPRCL
jgi:hypothetical protein